MRPDVSQKRQATKQAVTDLLADYISEYEDVQALITLQRNDLDTLLARSLEIRQTIDSLKISEQELTDEVV